MSIHDETWDKCKYCHKIKRSWDGNIHNNGDCMNKTYLNTCKHCNQNFGCKFKYEVICDQCLEKMGLADYNLGQHEGVSNEDVADQIIGIFYDLGFTTTEKFEYEDLKKQIFDVIAEKNK